VVPLHLVIVSLKWWLQREQHEVIQYLREENQVLKAQLRRSVCGSPSTNGGVWLCAACVSVAGCRRR
jgi:hypothetical protein